MIPKLPFKIPLEAGSMSEKIGEMFTLGEVAA